MPFELTYKTRDEIPSEISYLYSQVGDEFKIVDQSSFKTTADTDRLNNALTMERNDHKSAKSKLALWQDLDPTETLQKLDRVAELEAANAGKIDESKMNEMVEGRLSSRTAPLEREVKKLSTEREELLQKVSKYEALEKKRVIHDEVRKACVDSKVLDTASADVLFIAEHNFEVTDDGRVITKDGCGMQAGLDAKVWLSENKSLRPHWWPADNGMNAGGGKGGSPSDNPFKTGNMTEQGRLYKENPDLARQMAKQAGVVIGG